GGDALGPDAKPDEPRSKPRERSTPSRRRAEWLPIVRAHHVWQAEFFERILEHPLSWNGRRAPEGGAPNQVATERVCDRQRVPRLSVPYGELPLEVGAPCVVCGG